MATATSIPSASENLPFRRRALHGRRSDPTPTLFPDVPNQRDSGPSALLPPGSAPERVGIARLAFSSPLADAKRGTEYFLLPVKSILNHCESERVPFSWTVNPYRGCEFGCQYCYARYTHEYMELDGHDFEKKIYVKADSGPLARRDLGMEKVQGEHIAIGTATDPYQPAEREFGATRAILEQMAARKGLSVSITTKSDQVLRDVDLLRRISEHSGVSVNLSITTLRTRLARILEPRAPRPDLRLRAVQELRRAGIAAGVFAMPIFPASPIARKTWTRWLAPRAMRARSGSPPACCFSCRRRKSNFCRFWMRSSPSSRAGIANGIPTKPMRPKPIARKSPHAWLRCARNTALEFGRLIRGVRPSKRSN